MTFSSLLILHKKLNPFWHLKYYQCHQTLRRLLLPHIQRNLDTEKRQSKKSSSPQTIVDLTLAEIQQEADSAKSKDDFVEDVIGLTKQFIFAGHDTTAIALCFTFHFMSKNPDTLQKMVCINSIPIPSQSILGNRRTSPCISSYLILTRKTAQ